MSDLYKKIMSDIKKKDEEKVLRETIYTSKMMVKPVHRTVNSKFLTNTVYIILTKTNTPVGKGINLVMGTEYNHASIGLDSTFNKVYSFGRNTDVSNTPGFIMEQMDGGIYRDNDADYVQLKLPVTKKEYTIISRTIQKFYKEKHKFKFDKLGLVLSALNIERNQEFKFFCSAFVSYTLEQAGITLFDKSYGLVRPNDFALHPDLQKVSEGKAIDKAKEDKKAVNEEAILTEGNIQQELMDEDDFDLMIDNHDFNKDSVEYIEEISVINESINPKVYHLSGSNLDGKTLTPKVPENFMTKNGYEDNKTPRVCFAKDIDGCLKGMSANLTDKKFFVHIPDGSYNIKNITTNQVPDSTITGEVWITEKVKLKCIGQIEVTGDDGKDGIKYTYGDKTAELYGWKWKWISHLNESAEIIMEASAQPSSKRKKAEELIYKVISTLDPTGINLKKYKDEYSKMSDEQFDKFMRKFLKDEDENFYLEILPSKNEPNMTQIDNALKLMKIPKEEFVYLRHDGHIDDPIRTRTKVPTGYLNVRRLQQILSKKNTYSLDISSRNMKTGQVSGADKIARISDAETYALTAVGATNALKEFMGPRADNATSKRDMYKNINLYGYSYLKDLSHDITENQTINTIYTYLLGSGLENDLLKEEDQTKK